MAKFNVGDKVRRVKSWWNNMGVGDIDEVTHIYTHTKGDTSLTLAKHGCGHNSESFELLFTKADLKDGMRVVYRNGFKRVVFANSFYEVINENLFLSLRFKDYSHDLTMLDYSAMDIVKVYERDGTLLWERREQTQAQQEYEELQKTIKELQNKADALGKLIK